FVELLLRLGLIHPLRPLRLVLPSLRRESGRGHEAERSRDENRLELLRHSFSLIGLPRRLAADTVAARVPTETGSRGAEATGRKPSSERFNVAHHDLCRPEGGEARGRSVRSVGYRGERFTQRTARLG